MVDKRQRTWEEGERKAASGMDWERGDRGEEGRSMKERADEWIDAARCSRN